MTSPFGAVAAPAPAVTAPAPVFNPTTGQWELPGQAPAAPAAPPAPAAAPSTPFTGGAPAPAQAPAAAPVAGASATGGAAFGGGDPFKAPSGISGEKITQFAGELLLVKPTEVIEEMKTSRGVAKGVIRGNVAVLSGARAGETISDMLVFQTALKRELTTRLQARVDNPTEPPCVLGRLGKSRDKGDGNDPAWIFVMPSDADFEYAKAWCAQHPGW